MSNTVITTITDNIVSGPAPITITPDGATVYVGQFSGAGISVIDTASNTVTQTFALPAGALSGFGMAPDGSKFYAPAQFSLKIV